MATTSDSAAGQGAPPDPRRRRRLLWRGVGAFAVLSVLVVTAIAGFAYWRFDRALHASYPQTSGALRVGGLSTPVTVDRDAAGIPQIYAASPADLFLAQGYVQAQDRFWQMDVTRHYAEGTLAAMLGAAEVPHDELARTLGWRDIAAQSYAKLEPQTRAYLEAYSQGVNDFLSAHSGGEALSIEYDVLGLPDTHTAKGYQPAAWTPVDTLSWLEAVAWDDDVALGEEVSRSLLTATLTRAQIDELYPADGADSGFDAWAVSGGLTESGLPLLASAPVAPPALPSAWYQVGLHCTNVGPACPYDVAGYTQPGVPGVLIGHNDEVAWSWSGRGAHDSEIYLEKVTGSEYSYDGRARALSLRGESIEVAGGAPVEITVRSTDHGPLLSDISPSYRQIGFVAPAARSGGSAQVSNQALGYAVSVQDSALVPNNTADALFALDRADGWDQFTTAASEFTAPAEGMVYADIAGNIGYQGPAAVPERVSGDDGTWPVPGWTSSYNWEAPPGTGSVPVQEYDPTAGFISAEPGDVVGIRAERTADDLQRGATTGRKLTATDLTSIQDDAYDPEAAILVPYLLKVDVDDFTESAVALLRGWDYTEPAGSSAAAYYNAVWSELLKLVIGKQVPQIEASQETEQAAFNGSARWDAVVNALLTQPGSSWWGEPGPGRVSARDALLTDALEKARLDLTSLMGKDVSQWTWGRVHTMTPSNQSLGVGARPALFKWLLDGNTLGLPGGGSDVAGTEWNVGSGGFAVAAAPALRMVVDLGQLDDSRWIGQTGESGHVDDSDYLDQAPLWAAGETRSWVFSPAAVTFATRQHLTLDPN